MGETGSRFAPTAGSSDQKVGKFDQAVGSAKEALGRAVGSERLVAEGFLQKHEGKMEEKEGDIKRAMGQ